MELEARTMADAVITGLPNIATFASANAQECGCAEAHNEFFLSAAMP